MPARLAHSNTPSPASTRNTTANAMSGRKKMAAMTVGAAISAVITRCFSMRPADRGALRAASESALTLTERFECVGQTDFVELGPVRVREIQLAVCEIPQQEVAD